MAYHPCVYNKQSVPFKAPFAVQSPVRLSSTMKKSCSEKRIDTGCSSERSRHAKANQLPETKQSRNQIPFAMKSPTGGKSACKAHTESPASQEDAPAMPRSSLVKAVMIDRRYEIKKKIDEGTYAKVYLARDWQRAGSECVLKILRSQALAKPENREQVQREVANHGKLEHKHVLRLLDSSFSGRMQVKGQLDEQNKFVYLVTEYLGPSYLNMFDLIEHSGGRGFGEDAARFFLEQMLAALDYIHSEKSVVHRDLKLENILIDSEMNFKLIDFGLSDSGNIKEIAGAVGSPSYVAPEVLEDLVYDGSRVDLFSMGVLVFIMALGKFPHGTKILTDKYYALIRSRNFEDYYDAVEASHTSLPFRQLIFSLLAYAPSERPTIAQIREGPFLRAAGYDREATRVRLLAIVHRILAKQRRAK